MTKIITLAQQKGGVGKSTIAINLAHAFKEGAAVAVIDLDKQGSLMTLKDKSDIPILPYTGKVRELPYDFIFIDTPPYFNEHLPEILRQSDLVIMPTKAGIYDVYASMGTTSLIKSAQSQNPALKAAILLNMINPSTTLTAEAKEILEKTDIPILKATITERVDFIRSAALGDGIYSTKSSKGIEEINALTIEVLLLLQNNGHKTSKKQKKHGNNQRKKI